MSLFTLFSISFLASTLLPGGSEVYFSYLLLNSQYSGIALIFVATMGNTLGGFSNWIIGRFFSQYGSFNNKPTKHTYKAQQWIQRWGAPSLLLSWLPIIGDPLCLVAGLFRIGWVPTLVFIFIGKCCRYTALYLLVS